MSTSAINLSPIGYVRQHNGAFVLELDRHYCPALKELEGFSHVHVLWWGHLYATEEHRAIMQCDQPYRHAPEKVGIFATRSPVRPNPIALTPVAILSIDSDNGLIHVPYIDAEDGTPILDLKPYYPLDRIKAVSTPAWCRHWPHWYEDSADFDWAAEFMFAQ
jgi:tRNA (adenine37-N6)-methyltransferase